MKLHLDKEAFNELVPSVSIFKNIPESAVRRDYLIVFMLQKLSNSIYTKECVFKGGTSLSKGYPGSIERFSEDIDLTYLCQNGSDKKISNGIKTIEKVMSKDLMIRPINNERSKRSKSSYIWLDNENEGIKLEIGSSIRPDPYQKKEITTYIQEYLEAKNMIDVITEYDLSPIEVNVLDITRTFLDKVMSVKRHALSGNLAGKARHIYDVVRLYQRPETKAFFEDKEKVKHLVKVTKDTDSFYLEKRQLNHCYYPKEDYQFKSWKDRFTQKDVIKAYEKLHEELLYTSEKQLFSIAIETFQLISNYFDQIDE